MRTSEETPTEELMRLLDASESHRVRSLAFDDLRRIARLYRGETARLARLRSRGRDQDQIAHLNALCVRAHAFLYGSARPTSKRKAFTTQLIDGLRAGSPYVLFAWLIMAIGTVIGFFLVRLDATALYALMPSGLGYGVEQIDALYSSAAARDAFFARDVTPTSENALFGATLFSHNTQVGILSFATGILGGIPTLLLQFYNGIMVGTIAAIFLHGEHAMLFLAWILPHGVPELTAISLCCGAGFALGRAIALPGRLTREAALRANTPIALALFLASIPLFFAAAAIESFVRESALGSAPRFGAAIAGALVLLLISALVQWVPTRETRTRGDVPDWLDEFRAPIDSQSTQLAP